MFCPMMAQSLMRIVSMTRLPQHIRHYKQHTRYDSRWVTIRSRTQSIHLGDQHILLDKRHILFSQCWMLSHLGSASKLLSLFCCMSQPHKARIEEY
jgi:hypothetical protein